MPGLWTALHKLKGAGSPVNPILAMGKWTETAAFHKVLKGLMKAVLSLRELTSCLSGWERDVRLLHGQERKHRQPREREKICWHSQQGAFLILKKNQLYVFVLAALGLRCFAGFL